MPPILPAPLVPSQTGLSNVLPSPKPGVISYFDHDDFSQLVELAGARLAWSRAARCPCESVNTDTKQPDPNCVLCRGHGIFYFMPEPYTIPADRGVIDGIQTGILANSALIRGLVQRVQSMPDGFNILGNWVKGDMLVSVRPENVLGYLDRLVQLDAVITYDEVVPMPVDGSVAVTLRYPVVELNMARSLTTRFAAADIRVESDGTLTWLGTPPTAGTFISYHYLCHPTWIVTKHPHVLRETAQRTRQIKHGPPKVLPVQAFIKLEFVPEA